jgi:hypothetical protein
MLAGVFVWGSLPVEGFSLSTNPAAETGGGVQVSIPGSSLRKRRSPCSQYHRAYFYFIGYAYYTKFGTPIANQLSVPQNGHQKRKQTKQTKPF